MLPAPSPALLLAFAISCCVCLCLMLAACISCWTVSFIWLRISVVPPRMLLPKLSIVLPRTSMDSWTSCLLLGSFMFTPSPAFTAVFVSSTISWVSCWMADPKSLNSLPQSVSVALWTISLVDFWTFVASSLAMLNHEKEEVGSPRVPEPPWPEEPPSSSSTGSSLGARNALNMAPPSTSDPLNTRLLLPRPLVETPRRLSSRQTSPGGATVCRILVLAKPMLANRPKPNEIRERGCGRGGEDGDASRDV